MITNGVDVPEHDSTGESASELRAELGIDASAFVVGSVGRLVEVKSFESLVKVVAELSHQNHLHVVLVGDGPEEERLKELSRSLGVAERVHLVGEQQNVGDWLKAMDVYVNCSLSEGMSQSVLEAMSVGLPMVVTDVGANRSLVDGPGGCGMVVPAGDDDALARTIEQCIESPQQRSAMSGNALARYEQQYTVGEMLRQYEDLYDRLSSDRRRAEEPASYKP